MTRLKDRVALVFEAGSAGPGWDDGNAAVVLASDEAAFITAIHLPVDGGLTARCA